MDRPQETATKTAIDDETKTKNRNANGNSSDARQMKSTNLNPFHTLVESGDLDEFLRGACFGCFLWMASLGSMNLRALAGVFLDCLFCTVC